jgi:hypothetical protein
MCNIEKEGSYTSSMALANQVNYKSGQNMHKKSLLL